MPELSIAWHRSVPMVYNPIEFASTESVAMPVTGTPVSPEESEIPETTEISEARYDRGIDRKGIAVAAAILLACGGFVAYGVLDPDEARSPRQAVPAASVTYEVLGEGTADISYRGPSAARATVVTNARLPWKKTVSVPLGASSIVSVTLGENGGTASCTLAVGGKHIQRGTAIGSFGRTTCSSELLAPAVSSASEEAT
ncbi:MmpS family transport accessory protein [Streptomyces sp. NPDC102409]|uniref:MmpS family transport accessory protein n=1 Tax=Streptomyces sp. NPDC102409 TaxID=3366172 RepID=UPI0037F35EEB